jgi:hemolysin activation/secretion protein
LCLAKRFFPNPVQSHSPKVVALIMVLAPVFSAARASEAPPGGPKPELSAAAVLAVVTNSTQEFPVRSYALKGDPEITGGGFASSLPQPSGTNISLREIVAAASALQSRFISQGFTNVSITIGSEGITNGVVPLICFHGTMPQIVVDGWRVSGPDGTVPALSSAVEQASKSAASTNAPRRFLVKAYEIHGDTLLTTETLMKVLPKYTGTNVTIPDIIKARADLQTEYLKRGFVTVKVLVPQQIITNGMVRFEVIKGRLAEINVVNNRYFSSNNVMRALPGLHTNMILVNDVFQAELDRANLNQDRQIYPHIDAGPTEGTSTLDLQVKDRLPLHAKVDFNNQNSPGTPDLRLNTSAVYNNLWQLDHSVGVQYAFSPLDYKTGDQWNFYDRPQVANFGGFYRMPLGSPAPIAETLAANPGSFGYDEATRKFRLPPPSGQPELNFFASRSTIDTGRLTLSDQQLYNTNGNTLERIDQQQDITVNNSAGARLSVPLLSTDEKFQSVLSGGFDLKSYDLSRIATNIYLLTSVSIDTLTLPATTNINRSTNLTQVKLPPQSVQYLPLSLRYDASLRDRLGVTSFGLGLGVNVWHSGDSTTVKTITGSSDSSGYWFTVNPTLSRTFTIHTNWLLSLAASGQWATEPLISIEQFSLGGLGNLRGYYEGDVFGSDGWWLTAEQKTPPVVLGRVYRSNMLSVRGSAYTGFGQAFLLSGHQDLWSAGFGVAASVGPSWDARFFFSLPFISTPNTEAEQPRFDFSLSWQW